VRLQWQLCCLSSSSTGAASASGLAGAVQPFGAADVN
jgi:hypothetical protein